MGGNGNTGSGRIPMGGVIGGGLTMIGRGGLIGLVGGEIGPGPGSKSVTSTTRGAEMLRTCGSAAAAKTWPIGR
jgi:hypothetical protein